MFRNREAAHKKADTAIGAAVSHLLDAKELLYHAVDHAEAALEHHEAEIQYHRDRHGDAVDAHMEAAGYLDDVTKALGQ